MEGMSLNATEGAGRLPLFVVIEGVDGTGKTSVASRLAVRLSGACGRTTSCSTPTGVFRDMRGRVDSTDRAELHYYYYLASVLQASQEIREMLAVQSVVCDRYIFSTQAYHRAAGVDVLPLESLKFVRPDAAFFLTTREDVRQKRLRARTAGVSEWDLDPNSADSRFDRVEREFRQMGLTEIDTTFATVDEVVERVFDTLIERGE